MHSYLRQLPEYRQAAFRAEQDERRRVAGLIRDLQRMGYGEEAKAVLGSLLTAVEQGHHQMGRGRIRPHEGGEK